MLLEKMKLAVLDGDFRRSMGEVGECRLRRDAALSFDLAAVLRRMASCRFMEGEAVMAGGDFLVRDGERAVDVGAGGSTRDSDVGGAGCGVTVAGGDVGGGEIKMRDLLMGF